MEGEFRKLLETFYNRINNSPHIDIYRRVLIDQLDQVQVEPIHVLTLTQQPSLRQVTHKQEFQTIKKAEILYKNSDFASVFLFGFLLQVLVVQDLKVLQEVEKKVNENIQIFFQDAQQSEQKVRYGMLFNGLFSFCQQILARKLKLQHIQKLVKSFYLGAIQRKGLKKIQKQKYGTEAQTILSFILGNNGYFPSKKQLVDHTSDAYEMNTLNFCINIQNLSEREQWTVGEGENHINIVKQKNGEFSISEHQLPVTQTEEQELTDDWLQILEESQKIRQQQNARTSKLFNQLNITIQNASPTKSMRSPKSANYTSLRKTNNNFI